MGDMRALDNHLLGWRSGGIPSDDLELGRVLDRLCVNQGFLLDLAQAFTVQRKHTHGLLGEHFPKTFGVEIPENAIVLASLRRATTYKINLLRSFLERSEIQLIAEKLGRPIFWLFGGLAHPADVPAMDSQQGLLELIYTINQRGGMLSADYYQGYSFETAKWLFPGLAWGGAWIGCTNPISPARSQGTEAFGPSYMKAALNGVHILGSHDGGAACLQDLPTVHIYGPRTFAAGVSAHNDLWGNESLGRNADILLTHGFVSELERVAGQIHQDLLRVEDGRAHQAPGLPAKIAAMFHIMSQWNGRVLMESYLSPTRKT